MRITTLLLMVLVIPAVAAGQTLQVPSVGQGRLHADHVRYDAQAKVFLAEGNVLLTLGDVEVRAQRLRLEQITQIFYAFGDVRVAQGDVALTAGTVTYDLSNRTARALGSPILVQGTTTIRAERMEFDLEKKQTIARNEVTVVNKDVTVKTAELRYDAAAGEALAESVIVLQPGRTVRARRMRYLPNAGRLELEGDVVVEQERGDRLVEEGVIKAPEEDEGKRLLASPIVLTCDRVVVLTEERTVRAEGSVTVTQQGRSASAAAAVYAERDRHLTLTGGVVLRDSDGGVLRADSVAISLADETVEATGHVVTEFTLKQGR